MDLGYGDLFVFEIDLSKKIMIGYLIEVEEI